MNPKSIKVLHDASPINHVGPGMPPYLLIHGTKDEAVPYDQSPHMCDKMKEAGYRWDPADRIWTHPVGGDSAMSTRIDAEKLYQEVRHMIRQEKGIEAGQEIPF